MLKGLNYPPNFAVPTQINQLKSFLIHSIEGPDEKTQLKEGEYWTSICWCAMHTTPNEC